MNNLIKKGVVVAVILLFVSVSVIPSTGTNIVEKSSTMSFNGNTLYVGGLGPGNYTTIQAAIDDADWGDTVFVYDDSSPYYENVVIDISIQLFGENKETTIINGGDIGDVIVVTADQVIISGFTIEDSGEDYSNHDAGIKLNSNENIIINNNIISNREGIFLSSSNRNNIVNNSINYNRNAIRLHDSSEENIISGNTIETWSFEFGMYIKDSNGNMIIQNTITNYDGGAVYILESEENNISENTVMKSEHGISLVYCTNSIISNNFLKQNEYGGIALTGSNSNIISQNTFKDDGLIVWDSYHNTILDNIVNGKSLMYFEDESDMIVPSNAGQIILVNCNNLVIENQEIKDTSVGIELWGSDNCEILQNTLTHNKANILLQYSNYTRIHQNTLSSNQSIIFLESLEIRNSVGNSITQNHLSSTVDYPRFTLYNSHYNNISENIFTDQFKGISVYMHSHDNNIVENTFSPKSGVNIYISWENNVIGNNDVGYISIRASDGNTVSENSINSENQEWGVFLEDAHQNTISNNDIRNCNGAISLTGSKSNNILKNNIIDCGPTPAWFSNFPLLNRWSRNYWGRSMLRPKIIHGEIRIERGWPYPDRVIPWFDFDWRPALRPYDIGEIDSLSIGDNVISHEGIGGYVK